MNYHAAIYISFKFFFLLKFPTLYEYIGLMITFLVLLYFIIMNLYVYFLTVKKS